MTRAAHSVDEDILPAVLDGGGGAGGRRALEEKCQRFGTDFDLRAFGIRWPSVSSRSPSDE